MNTSNKKKTDAVYKEALDMLLDRYSATADPNAEDELKQRRMVRVAMEKASMAASHGTPQKSRWRSSRMVLAAAFAITGVSTLMVWNLIDPDPGPNIPNEPRQADFATPIESAKDGSASDSLEKTEPRLLAHSSSPEEIAPGIKIVTTPDAELRLADKGTRNITMYLKKGTVWIEKDPNQAKPLEIRTPLGGVIVTGTILSVRVLPEQTVTVQVLKGNVQVDDQLSTNRSVHAGQMLTMGDETVEKLSDMELLEEWQKVAEVDLVEDRDIPPRLLQKPNRKVTPPLNLTAIEGDLFSMAEDDPESTSLESLLGHIEMLRSKHQWPEVCERYRELIDRYGQSDVARVAMVVLGTTLLEKMDKPKEAIKWFDEYLRTNSQSLAPEAMMGKTSALRKLGDESGELEVLNQIIHQYHNTPYARRAERRVKSIENR